MVAAGPPGTTGDGVECRQPHLALTGDGFNLAVLSREPYRENPLWLRGHSAEISSAAFSPDGRWLASSGWDSTTRIWDPRSGRLLLTQPEAGDVSWSAESLLVRWQLGENQSQSLVVLHADIPQVCRLLAEVPPSQYPASHKGPWIVETLADGRVLAVPSYEGVRLCDLATGTELAVLPTDHATSCNVVADRRRCCSRRRAAWCDDHSLGMPTPGSFTLTVRCR